MSSATPLPSGITLDSLNFRVERSYFILFLLPFGVSMMTQTGAAAAEERFREVDPDFLFGVISPSIAQSLRNECSVATHTGSAGRR